jgi:hypothetical protein
MNEVEVAVLFLPLYLLILCVLQPKGSLRDLVLFVGVMMDKFVLEIFYRNSRSVALALSPIISFPFFVTNTTSDWEDQ